MTGSIRIFFNYFVSQNKSKLPDMTDFNRLPAHQDFFSPSDGTLVGLCDALCREQDNSTRIADFSKSANSNFSLV